MKAFTLCLCVVTVGCSAARPVVYHDTRYTQGVTEVMAQCGILVRALTGGHNVPPEIVNRVYSRCLIDNGATL